MTQEFTELNHAEADWLRTLVGELRADGVGTQATDLTEYFNREWRNWASSPESDRTDPNPIINRIGAGLGALLADGLDLRWLVLTDEFGTDLVVKGEPHTVVLFPMNAVAKRWTDGELDWITPFVEVTSREVGRLRSA